PVAIGVTSATRGFGTGGTGGMSARLTGILGKFEIDVDLLAALTAVTSGNFASILGAFSVPGKFSVDVATVRVEVPGIVIATGAGIHVQWDPNYDPAAHNGKAQTLLTVDTADVTFPAFGVSAQITPFGIQPNVIPGLTVRTAGFQLGNASRTIRKTDDTLKIQLGSFLTLTATGFMLNTGAGPTEELVSFTSIGASVNIGSVAITGEARNFAFTGDGSFKTKPGFGVFLSVGGANGDSFKWPSWLPVHINSIGITWRDIQADPTDFVLILSASVEG